VIDFTSASGTDRAYIAGMLDGEGSIMIIKGHTKGRPWSRAASPDYTIRAAITNTNKQVLDWIQSKCGGSVYSQPGSKGTWGPSKRPIWFWRISGPRATEFLSSVREFLQIKAPQAWLALEAREQFTSGRKGKGVALSAEELALREGYYLAMKNLNAGTAGI